MMIGSHNTDNGVLIVAEIGNNHEGDIAVARNLVEQAAACGAGAVKVQAFHTERFVRRSDAARFKRMKSFELTPDQFADLAELARSKGLLFIATPLDLESARMLNDLVDAYKIASGDITFFPLIDTVCQTGKPMIISTGASDLAQVEGTVGFIRDHWERRGIGQQVAVLHCVSSYPAPEDQVHLSVLRVLAQRFGGPVGYSDHTIGIDACVAAVAGGAQIIEKHFTLDKHTSDFRDHQLSADPEEMKRLTEQVARIVRLVGRPVKRIQECEAPTAREIRRSIAAALDLPMGHELAWEDLTWLRPGSGIPPGEESKLLGRTLNRNLSDGEHISLADVE